jgi:anti-sigma B factor antagonist
VTLMEYTVTSHDGITVLTLKEPNLTHSVSADLKAELLILAASDDNAFILDVSSVEDCDSDGLSALLFAQRTLAASDRTCKMVGVKGELRTMIRLSQFEHLFEFYPSLRAAEASCAPSKKK